VLGYLHFGPGLISSCSFGYLQTLSHGLLSLSLRPSLQRYTSEIHGTHLLTLILLLVRLHRGAAKGRPAQSKSHLHDLTQVLHSTNLVYAAQCGACATETTPAVTTVHSACWYWMVTDGFNQDPTCIMVACQHIVVIYIGMQCW
jgi:hypothetical protein